MIICFSSHSLDFHRHWQATSHFILILFNSNSCIYTHDGGGWDDDNFSTLGPFADNRAREKGRATTLIRYVFYLFFVLIGTVPSYSRCTSDIASARDEEDEKNIQNEWENKSIIAPANRKFRFTAAAVLAYMYTYRVFNFVQSGHLMLLHETSLIRELSQCCCCCIETHVRFSFNFFHPVCVCFSLDWLFFSRFLLLI